MVIQHGRIEGKSRKDNHEQDDTCQPQSRMREAMKEPAKRRTLQGPPHRDPLSVKLGWENQCTEEQRCASKECEVCTSGWAGEGCAFKHDKMSEWRPQG